MAVNQLIGRSKMKNDIKEHNKALRQRSSSVNSDNKLVEFLYILMRDHLPAGKVEGIMIDHVTGGENNYTNGWLATYAKDIARRLNSVDNVEIIANEQDKIFLTLTMIANLEFEKDANNAHVYRKLGETLVGKQSYEDFYDLFLKTLEWHEK